jgi:recombination protein RecR
MNLSSTLIENAVLNISKLPGIGKKSALRMVLHLLKEDPQITIDLATSLVTLRREIKYCQSCYNVSDLNLCSICTNPHRDKSIICVVEQIPDIIAVENTNHYNGLYHVLGGVISPIDGIGPSEINIESLLQKIAADNNIKEVILALSATMQADTTAFYISKKLRPYNLKLSTIARGIAVGSELEYTDEITLGRSIASRINFTL